MGYTHFKTRLLKSRPVVVGEEGLSSCPSASAQASQKPEMDQGVHACVCVCVCVRVCTRMSVGAAKKVLAVVGRASPGGPWGVG